MEKLIHIDDLCRECGYFTSDTTILGGYGCNHKGCDDGEYTCNDASIGYREAQTIVAKGFTKRKISCNQRLAKKFIKKARYLLNRDTILFGVKFQGACYSSSCPLGYRAEEEDIIRFGENPDCMTEGDWVVVDNPELLKEGN